MRSRILENSLIILIVLLLGLAVEGGQPTFKTITVDGNMQDWAEVLTNPNNVTIDGASSSNCANSTDRDCPVQSTGRDMVKFAWTYDSNNIYLYVQRTGNSSNIQNFFFIMDIGLDKVANSSDFVLNVSFQGSTRQTNITLYRYLPLNPQGDSLVDGNGLVDGYNMPGSLASISPSDPSYFVVNNLIAGSTDGLSFESYIPWSKLNLQSGSPIFFHVSSGNNSSLSQVDDNLGGPGGGIGAFAYYWVQIFPDNSLSVPSGSNPTYLHTVKNNGSFDDVIDVYAISSTSLPVALYYNGVLIGRDANGNGSFSDADDYVNPDYDLNSNGLPDLSLQALSSANINVIIESASLPDNSYDLTTVYAVSNGDGSNSSAKDETYVGSLSLYPDNYLSGTPSDYVNLNHTLFNGAAPDYFKFCMTSSNGFDLYLYKGADLVGIDYGGDGIWDSVNGSYDHNLDGFPDLFLTQGSSANFTIYVPIPSNVSVGLTETITFNANGEEFYLSSSAVDTIKIKPPFTFTPSYSFSNSTELYGAPNHPVYFGHKIVNNTSSPKRFTFYAPNYEPSNDSSWQIKIYSDPNGDGNPSDGSLIVNTDNIPEFGGEFNIVVEISIPSSVSPPAIANSLVTAVICSNSDCSSYDTNIRASVEDDLKVSYIVPFYDPNFTLQERNFAPCATLYSKAFNLVPDQTGRYAVRLIDPSSNILRDVSKGSDSIGSFTDEYIFESSAPSGNYQLQLIDNNNILDSITIRIERSGSDVVNINQLGRDLTDSLFFSSTLYNDNSFVNYKATKIWYIVKDPTNTLYLKEDGSWQAITSSSYTKLFSNIDLDTQSTIINSSGFASIVFPSYGVYTLRSTWENSCGDISNENDNIFSSYLNFYVASLESYSDSPRTVLKDNFTSTQSIFFKGEGYLPSTSYNIAIYTSSGSIVSYQSQISESDGTLLYEIPPSTLSPRDYILVVFPSYVTPPLNYVSDNSLRISDDIFTVYDIVLLRYGGVSNINPLTPSKSEIFVNFPNDPSLSTERDAEVYNFVSGSSFAHESSDLLENPPLVFYQVGGISGDSLRVSKDGGHITITY